jgi:serine protease Do
MNSSEQNLRKLKNNFFINNIKFNTMNAKRVLGMILMAALGGFVALYSYTRFIERPKVVFSANQPAAQQIRVAQPTGNNPVDLTYAAERTVHAVVHVKTKTNQGSSGNSFYDFFFGYRESRPEPIMGVGSGVIISNDGYIVTNNHVIESADNIEVTLNDKRICKSVKIVGTDPVTDLAVLKVEEKDLPFIPYGNSDDLKVGEWVLAVGNPLNLTSTVTAGIVSAKARSLGLMGQTSDPRDRRVNSIESFIQTDAAVNPGNSGGALVNTRGELVGINTAIISPTGSYVGNSFAIPVTIVKKVVADLIEYGNVQRGLLGITIDNMDGENATKTGMDKIEGVLVTGLTDNSAAESAGIKQGDVILSVNGAKVNSVSELQEQVSRYRPNDKVELLVSRENKQKQFSVILRNREGNTKLTSGNEIFSLLGAQLAEASSPEKSKLGIKGGVKVVSIGPGKLKAAGIEKGFIITGVNDQPVNSVDDLKRILSGVRRGVYIEGIYTNGIVCYYAFGI